MSTEFHDLLAVVVELALLPTKRRISLGVYFVSTYRRNVAGADDLGNELKRFTVKRVKYSISRFKQAGKRAASCRLESTRPIIMILDLQLQTKDLIFKGISGDPRIQMEREKKERPSDPLYPSGLSLSHPATE